MSASNNSHHNSGNNQQTQQSSQPPPVTTNLRPTNRSTSTAPPPPDPRTTYASIAATFPLPTQHQPHTHIPIGARSPGGTEVIQRTITTTTRSPGGRVLQETLTLYPPTPVPTSIASASAGTAHDNDNGFIVYNESGEMYFDLRDFIGDRLDAGQRVAAICRECLGFILEGAVHQCPAAGGRVGNGN